MLLVRLLIKVDSIGKRYSLLPITLELKLDEVEERDIENLSFKMRDFSTGRDISCQVSCSTENNNKKVLLSWILLNEAQREFEVTISPNRRTFFQYPFIFGEVKDRGNKELEIYFGKEHIANYIFNEAYERPFLYPVIGPDGLCVTRQVPSFGDHPHHKGIGLALGEVSSKIDKTGIDFWGIGKLGDPKQGRVIHQRFTCLEQGPVFVRIVEENIWKQNDEFEEPYLEGRLPEPGKWRIKNYGEILLYETRIITVWNTLPNRTIDIQTVMRPAQDEVVLNADIEKKDLAKENGPLLIRVADNMRGTVKGTIVNSEGGRGEKECWGRRARWVDYYGPVIPNGPINGIAVLDHPGNLRHPPGWHVRDYGLFAPNIFYSKKPEWPDQGPVYLSKSRGDKLSLYYRIYVHRGDEKEGRVEEKWQGWANPPRVSIERVSIESEEG
jgi:hypothetical protein